MKKNPSEIAFELLEDERDKLNKKHQIFCEISKEHRHLQYENFLLWAALKSVKDYFKNQGTGRIFHLGYSGDLEKEKFFNSVLSSLPDRTAKLSELVDAAIDFADNASSGTASQYINKRSRLDLAVRAYKEVDHA